MLLSSSDTRRTLMHLFLFTPPRDNWFHYVCREYATAINFPYIITLLKVDFEYSTTTRISSDKHECVESEVKIWSYTTGLFNIVLISDQCLLDKTIHSWVGNVFNIGLAYSSQTWHLIMCSYKLIQTNCYNVSIFNHA